LQGIFFLVSDVGYDKLPGRRNDRFRRLLRLILLRLPLALCLGFLNAYGQQAQQ
jgi:hypothetical protein